MVTLLSQIPDVMKTKPSTLVIAAILASAATCPAESPAENLEQGVFLQETKNDPAAAAEVYRQIIEEASAGRLLAAEASYRLALCLKQLDQPAESRKVLEALVADEKQAGEWATKAIELLGSHSFVHPAPWKSGELATYQILGPAGQKLGALLSAIEETVDPDGTPRWTSYFVRTGGMISFSRCTFSKEDYHAITSRAAFEGFGDSSTKFNPDGLITVSDASTGKLRWERKPDAVSPLAPAFDNDQVIQLLRAVPQKKGTKISTEVIAPLAAAPVPFIMEVADTETVETDAGDFECVEITSNIGQNFLVSTAPDRRLIAIKAGAARIEASEFIDWKPTETTHYVSRSNKLSVTFPAGILWTPPEDKEETFSVLVFPIDFAATGGGIRVRKIDKLPESARKSAAAFAKHEIAKAEGNYDEFKMVGDSEIIEHKGLEASLSHLQVKKGELDMEYLFIHSVTADQSVIIRLQISKGKLTEARKLATALFEGIEFD